MCVCVFIVSKKHDINDACKTSCLGNDNDGNDHNGDCADNIVYYSHRGRQWEPYKFIVNVNSYTKDGLASFLLLSSFLLLHIPV